MHNTSGEREEQSAQCKSTAETGMSNGCLVCSLMERERADWNNTALVVYCTENLNRVVFEFRNVCQTRKLKG